MPFTRRGLRPLTRPSSNLPQTAVGTLFTIIGGAVRIASIWGEVTTVIQTQANATKLIFNPTGTGASTDLCATLDITADAVGQIYSITGTVATAMKSATVQLVLPADNIAAPGLCLNEGTIELSCAASNTGAVKWTLLWEPLELESDITAAAVT